MNLLRLAFASFAAFCALTGGLACSAAERLPLTRTFTVPLSELSGLAVRALPDGERDLLAVGDETRELVVIPLGPEGPDPSRARHVALPMPETPGGSELEGVAVDTEGLVHVIAERGEIFTYRLDGDSAVEVAREPITTPPEHSLAAAWQADVNARAEGIALLGRRTFIIKQKDPVALIELARSTSGLTLHTHWRLPDLEDASDLAAVGDRLYVIGARSGTICALPIPTAQGHAAGGELACLSKWALPDELGQGRPRWEGLAILPTGAVVGVDRKKTDSPNLGLLPPLR